MSEKSGKENILYMLGFTHYTIILLVSGVLFIAATSIYLWQTSQSGLTKNNQVVSNSIADRPSEEVNNKPPRAHRPSQVTLPKTCKSEAMGVPVITSISSTSGYVGDRISITGCNLSGFESDTNLWIENSQGVKGLLYGEPGSTDKKIEVILKSPLCQKDVSYSGLECDAFLTLSPGEYQIYTSPWRKESNKVKFIIH